jgi:hypothetical protein
LDFITPSGENGGEACGAAPQELAQCRRRVYADLRNCYRYEAYFAGALKQFCIE